MGVNKNIAIYIEWFIFGFFMSSNLNSLLGYFKMDIIILFYLTNNNNCYNLKNKTLNLYTARKIKNVPVTHLKKIFCTNKLPFVFDYSHNTV